MSNVRKDERSDNPLTLPLLARNHAAKGNSYRLLQRMDQYYNDLWRENNAEDHQETVSS